MAATPPIWCMFLEVGAPPAPPIWCMFLEAGAPPVPEVLKTRLAESERRFKDARDACSRRLANALARSV